MRVTVSKGSGDTLRESTALTSIRAVSEQVSIQTVI